MFITLLIFLLILGLLVFVHEFGHYWVAKKNGVTVHEFAFGFRPRLFSWKRGETEYAINLIPLGGYVRLEGESEDTGEKGSLQAQPPHKRIAVFAAGVVMNLILAWVLLTLTYAIGSYALSESFARNAGQAAATRVTLAQVIPNSPAEQAGLKAGDQLVKVGETIVDDPRDVTTTIQANVGQPLSLTFVRDGQEQTVQATPRQNPPAGEGALGISPQLEPVTVRIPWYQAPGVALKEVGSEIVSSFNGFIGFVQRLVVRQEVSEDVTGIVGIGAATGVVRQFGIGALMQFAALISVNLAVINILPILPLDGGHILFTVIEWIRKRPVQEAYRQYVAMAGLGAILLLFLIVTYQDILNFALIDRIKNLF